MSDKPGFLSKSSNDVLTIASFALATCIALSQLWLFFYPSPREAELRRLDRTEQYESRFREVWYGSTITQFRDAIGAIERNDLPADFERWAATQLDRIVPMTNVLRGIANCVREEMCESTILDVRLCEVTTLYDEGFRALGVLTEDYPDDSNEDVKWILTRCGLEGET